MILEFKLSSGVYKIDSDAPLDISIPLIFNGEQPNTYGVDNASSKACEVGDFIGDTRRGGSCNFDEYKLIAHCNGTHTECIGHISLERIAINETLNDVFIPSALITVQPEKADSTQDTYSPVKDNNDYLITKVTLENKLGNANKDFLEGLIIRTLPNDDSKKSRRYMDNQPAFFSLEAMEYIKQLGVKHLLTDLPSVDRTFDEGKLSAHHIFWNVEQGSHQVDAASHSLNTITEMIYVPDNVPDGLYLLNIQAAPFKSDASPSRPVIFKIQKDGW
jgi:arylformamidase